MRSIREGDRGPAVEDVQRRLLGLGYALGPTGVDGVFMGATRDAVVSFQRSYDLSEDGVVGDETWSALVDASFTLGDRMLYLRSPFLHGHDVESLQRALNTLGFACGAPDGIFGPFTERAVREFQRNCALPADGIAGGDTVSTLKNLRHVWEAKEGTSPSGIALGPARAAQALTRSRIRLMPADPTAALVAERVVNLALAADEGADVALSFGMPEEGALVVRMTTASDGVFGEGVPVASVDPEEGAPSTARVVAAVSSACGELATVLRLGDTSGERSLQRAAVVLLDGICAALD